MTRRLGALVLALVIVGAPVAATMCRVTCESQHTEGMVGHAHHHSRTQSTPVVGAEVNGLPHTCGHQTDDLATVQQTLQLLAAPPALLAVQAFSISLAMSAASAGRPLDIEHSPPGLIALATQLRV